MNEILVSIVIPAFRCARYLRQALDSALAQDVPEEILIIDDCSDDGLEEIVGAYCGYPQIRYIRNEQNLGVAESRNLTKLLIANHGGDHTIYPDCRPEFISAMDSATNAGTYVGVRVVAPYTNITKGDIARIGKKLGIDYAETWSCYKGGEKHCGKCGTCVERKEALAYAGIEDTTEYEG